MERYRVNRVIGEGSFGKAVLCVRISDDKTCVIKQIDTSKLPSKARREARKEATLLATLSHPNIVGFWESFLHGRLRDILCIVMEYADGGDLSSCIRARNGRLIEEEIILNWFVQITLALKHIHDRKILHRDLKTQNVFLTRSRVVKLGDFGIAKVLNNTMDLARTAIGTPYFMSPEICQEKSYNHKSDIWSLGCVLYEMTCLRHAFDGGNMRLLAMKITSQEPRPIAARYSAGLRGLLAQLLRKDPRARPSTGSVLRRPLVKERIGRFLSEAQMEEEFSHTVLHDRRHPERSPVVSTHPSLATSSADAAVGTRGTAAHRPLPAHDPPRWPFPLHLLGERPSAFSPSAAQDGHEDPAAAERAVAGKVAREAAPAAKAPEVVQREKDGGADGETERKNAARKKRAERERHLRQARKRANVAAAALGVGQKPSPRRSTPRRDQRVGEAEVKKDPAVEDATAHAKERAKIARAALGVGGRSPSRETAGVARAEASPRTAAKAQSRRSSDSRSPTMRGKENSIAVGPHRSSQRPLPPPEGPEARDQARVQSTQSEAEASPEKRESAAGVEDRYAFQRVQNLRGGLQESMFVHGDRKSGRQGQQTKEGLTGDVAVDAAVDEANAGSDLARRRRAARAVFGAGFGKVHGDDEIAPSTPCNEQDVDQKDSPLSLDAFAASENCVSSVTPVHQAVPADTQKQTKDESTACVGPEDMAADPLSEARVVGEEEKSEAHDAEDVGKIVTVEETCGSPMLAAEEKVPFTRNTDHRFDDSDGDAVDSGGAPAKSSSFNARSLDAERDAETSSPRVGDCSPTYEAEGVMDDRGGRAGGGSGGTRTPRIDLGLDEGWLQNLEAKMGAIKAQVDQIKSPPDFTSRRRGEGADHVLRHVRTQLSVGNGISDHHEESKARQNSGVAQEYDVEDPSAEKAVGAPALGTIEERNETRSPREHVVRGASKHASRIEVALNGVEGDATSVKLQDQADQDGFQPLEELDTPSVYLTPIGRGSLDSQNPTPAKSQSRSKLLSAAAAIEAAAAAVAAIPKTPRARRVVPARLGSITNNSSGRAVSADRVDQEDDKSGEPSSGESRVEARMMEGTSNRKETLGDAALVTTPAQRRRGRSGRALRTPKASVVARSEKKPSRRAAASVANLGRHSEGRRTRNNRGEGQRASGDTRESDEKAKAPSTEERVQALRAARDRERAELRALIARRRGGPSREDAANGATNITDGNANGEARKNDYSAGAPVARPHDASSGWAAITPTPREQRIRGRSKVPASDPQPSRRAFQSQKKATPTTRLLAGVRSRATGSGRGKSRRPGRESGDDAMIAGDPEVDQWGADGKSPVASRDPVKRHQDLRAFIAAGRRRRRQDKNALKSDARSNSGGRENSANDDNGNDDISVWTAAVPTPSSVRTDASREKPAAPSSSHLPRPATPDAVHDVVIFGPRRNLAFEVNEEEKLWVDGRRDSAGALNDPVTGSFNGNDVHSGENLPAAEVGTGEERGVSGSSVAVVDAGVAGGKVLSRQRNHSEEILAELSMLEPFVVDELHEVARGQMEGQEEEESLIHDEEGGLLEQVAGKQYRLPTPDENDSAANQRAQESTLAESEAASIERPTSVTVNGPSATARSPGSNGQDKGGTSISPDCNALWSFAGERGGVEGVNLGLATYELQRAGLAESSPVAAGMTAGAEKYAQMLVQMQEVLELNDRDSTDSSWGDSMDTNESKGGRTGNGGSSNSSRSDSSVSQNDSQKRGYSATQCRESTTEQKQSDAHETAAKSGETMTRDGGKIGRPRYGAKLASKLSWRSLHRTKSSSSLSAKATSVAREGKETNRSLTGEKEEDLQVCLIRDDQALSVGTLSSRFEYSGMSERGEHLNKQLVSLTASDLKTEERNPGNSDEHGPEDQAKTGELMPSPESVLGEEFDAIDPASCGGVVGRTRCELKGLAVLGLTTTSDADCATGSIPRREEHARDSEDGLSFAKSVAEFEGMGQSQAVGRLVDASVDNEHSKDGRKKEGETKIKEVGVIIVESDDEASRTETRAGRLSSEEVSLEVPGSTRRSAKSAAWPEEGGGERTSLDSERVSLDREESAILQDRLEHVLGSERFRSVCRYLREVDLDGGDDEKMTTDVESILGGAEHLRHLPDLLRLAASQDVALS